MRWNLLCRNTRGNTLATVAIIMVLLLVCSAVAVDAGYLYSEKTKLATAADAAALAGAGRLPDPNTAKSEAKRIAMENGVATDKAIIGVDTTQSTVAVIVSKEVSLFFARFIGHDSTVVSARAKAKSSPPKQMKGLMPMGIAANDFNSIGYYKEFNIKLSTNQQGNFRLVNYSGGGGGADEIKKVFVNGYDGVISVGKDIMTETGNKLGPVEKAYNDRVAGCKCTPPYVCPKCNCENCPRIGYVPVVSSFDVPGSKNVKVVGFAAIIITGLSDSGEIKAYFTEVLVETAPNTGSLYGVRSIKLVE